MVDNLILGSIPKGACSMVEWLSSFSGRSGYISKLVHVTSVFVLSLFLWRSNSTELHTTLKTPF